MINLKEKNALQPSDGRVERHEVSQILGSDPGQGWRGLRKGRSRVIPDFQLLDQ